MAINPQQRARGFEPLYVGDTGGGMVKLTKSRMLACQNAAGGYTKATLVALGLPDDTPIRGLENRVKRWRVTREQYALALAGKHRHW